MSLQCHVVTLTLRSRPISKQSITCQMNFMNVDKAVRRMRLNEFVYRNMYTHTKCLKQDKKCNAEFMRENISLYNKQMKNTIMTRKRFSGHRWLSMLLNNIFDYCLSAQLNSKTNMTVRAIFLC